MVQDLRSRESYHRATKEFGPKQLDGTRAVGSLCKGACRGISYLELPSSCFMSTYCFNHLTDLRASSCPHNFDDIILIHRKPVLVAIFQLGSDIASALQLQQAARKIQHSWRGRRDRGVFMTLRETIAMLHGLVFL